MALLKRGNTRIIYLTTVVVLVLAIVSSTLPPCQASNIIRGHGSPMLSSFTCYPYKPCDDAGCAKLCEQKGKKKDGFKNRSMDPNWCCCED
ncbi:unnamed protein product [Urochloa decumbens]|uniref:LCR-like protein n=1 Tax=Urochloa decumbens TaxID=240449 RepID=A0ABC9B0M2_9POAL